MAVRRFLPGQRTNVMPQMSGGSLQRSVDLLSRLGASPDSGTTKTGASAQTAHANFWKAIQSTNRLDVRFPVRSKLLASFATAVGWGTMLLFVLIVGWVTGHPTARGETVAQGDGSVEASAQASRPVTFGITGHYRIGQWTAVRMNQAERVTPKDRSLETLDGDGVRVVYELPPSGDAEPLFGYVVPGTEAAPLLIRDGATQVTKTRFPEFGSPSRGASAIPIEMPWVVCIGDPLGVDQIGANEMLDRDPQIAVSLPRVAADLPDSSLGYQGVDILMLNAAGADLLKSLSPAQRNAITNWIQTGGRVFLTMGASAETLADAAGWLMDLLPLDEGIETVVLSPSAIETYTSTQQPLEEFVGVRLPKGVGEILLMGRTARRISTPMAVDYVVGLGRVTVIAADLDTEMFAAWPQRMDLIQRVTGDAFEIEKDKAAGNRITAFDDLAGQARSTLDQFPIKRRFGFSVLALILLALIALVGPLDYLVINRVFGKPLLGWLTFPIVVLSLCALLVSWSSPASVSASLEMSGKALSDNDDNGNSAEKDSGVVDSAVVQCNRFEFVDLDAIQKVGSGFAWSYLYSHPANQFDVTVQAGKSLDVIAETLTQNVTAPYGTPGPSFGGVQIAGEDARLPPYRVRMTDHEGLFQSQIKQLAIAPRSSKSFATRLQLTPALGEVPNVRRRRGSELLEGKLTNPLSVELLDAMLVYGNWVYLLPTRFRAGSSIESLAELRQKPFRWRLSRQEMLEKSDVSNESWVATDFSSPSRIAEMLMFHDAAGGSRYTGLAHGPLKQLDRSDLLLSDRCMLVGRLRVPLLDIQLRDVHQSGQVSDVVRPEGQTLSMVRVVLPVQTSRAR